MTGDVFLRRLPPRQVRARRRDAVDAAALSVATRIVDDVARGGEPSLRDHARRLDGLGVAAPLVIGRADLHAALASISHQKRDLLERMNARVTAFARAQRSALSDVCVPVPGGEAGHEIVPVERAGCYAPGGRFPLPSSVIMTAATARAAGVGEVWVASPRPAPITLAAAAVAGADALLAAGGAQAIAALAYGAGAIPPCDAVVGPGNAYVTAAKQLVAGRVAIDMLAGPSELVVLADESARADVVAADLLAQAEHDPQAFPALVTSSAALADAVDVALCEQLVGLASADIARAALAGGLVCVTSSDAESAEVCNRLAPEHLQLCVSDEESVRPLLRHYGALFSGACGAEVLGDYGAGPNHTLPTGETARSQGGLSVFTFLRIRTWLRIGDAAAAQALLQDAVGLAQLEGLEAHARAAQIRLSTVRVR